MRHTVTLELPDEVYQGIKTRAEAAGQPLEEWIVSELGGRLPDRQEEDARLQVHPEIYEILKQVAPQMGLTIEEMVLRWKEKYGKKPGPLLTDEEEEAAWERLRRHFGAVHSGDPRSADNERIDADLTREYGSAHQEGG